MIRCGQVTWENSHHCQNATNGFLKKWHLRKEPRNSKQLFNWSEALTSSANYQQYGNSALIPQLSFPWETGAGLSTLPDNPGDSRFWTISPRLQIRVWNLPDNRRSLPFLVDSTTKFQIFCAFSAILLLKSNVSSQTAVCHCKISNNVIGGK